jgi:hypothetical protein
MSTSHQPSREVRAEAVTSGQRIVNWLEDPMGQVVAATVATVGSFGMVLSGIWLVNIAVN